jgi:hypothetical protein
MFPQVRLLRKHFAAHLAVKGHFVLVNLLHVVNETLARAQYAYTFCAREFVLRFTQVTTRVLAAVLFRQEEFKALVTLELLFGSVRSHMLLEHRYRLALVRALFALEHLVRLLVLL